MIQCISTAKPRLGFVNNRAAPREHERSGQQKTVRGYKGRGRTEMVKNLTGLVALGFALTLAASPSESLAQDRTSIKIGWAISKTGPYTAGASVTVLPNYQIWAKDVNESGGIMLKSIGKKLPI
jgi:hypothetical protein